jgi:hypothetical protein
MENNFDMHQWRAKFLKEDSQRKMNSMEYLQEELPHLYSANGDISQSDIAYAMDQYAQYCDSFNASQEA